MINVFFCYKPRHEESKTDERSRNKKGGEEKRESWRKKSGGKGRGAEIKGRILLMETLIVTVSLSLFIRQLWCK